MRDVKSMDDIKELSDSITLPSIDVRENVMQKIYKRKEENHMINVKKLIICISLSIFLLCSVRYAVMKAHVSLNDSKNSSYAYKLNYKGGKIDPDQARLIETEWNRLEQGEALATLFVSAKDNPENKIPVLNKYKQIYNFDEIKKTFGKNFKVPVSLPGEFEFKEGHVGYGISEQLRNEMIEESKSQGKDLVVKAIKSTDVIHDYGLGYNDSENNEININVYFGWEAKESYERNKNKKGSKIEINKCTGIYTKNSGRREIVWLDSRNNSDTFYSVGCASGTLTKDKLLKIAESIMQQ